MPRYSTARTVGQPTLPTFCNTTARFFFIYRSGKQIIHVTLNSQIMSCVTLKSDIVVNMSHNKIYFIQITCFIRLQNNSHILSSFYVQTANSAFQMFCST
jgi:hypothetical protein